MASAWIEKRTRETTKNGKPAKVTSYVVRWREPDGVVKSKSCRTREVARDLRNEKADQLTRGTYVAEKERSRPVGEYIEDVWRASSASDQTKAKKQYLIDKWIIPFFSKVKLSEWSGSAVRRYLDWLTEEGCRSSARSQAFAITRRAARRAMREGLITRDPYLDVASPRHKPKHINPFTADEIELIAENVQPEGARIGVLLMGFAGLRQGEALAQRASDIDFDKQTILVSGTKTAKSRATLPMEPILCEQVRDFVQRCGVDLLVVKSQDEPILPKSFDRAFAAACTKLGLTGHRPHDLRHSFASMLIDQGRSILEVSKLLRHSSPTLTQTTYGHLYPEATREATQSLSALRRRVQRLRPVDAAG